MNLNLIPTIRLGLSCEWSWVERLMNSGRQIWYTSNTPFRLVVSWDSIKQNGITWFHVGEIKYCISKIFKKKFVVRGKKKAKTQQQQQQQQQQQKQKSNGRFQSYLWGETNIFSLFWTKEKRLTKLLQSTIMEGSRFSIVTLRILEHKRRFAPICGPVKDTSQWDY